MSFDDISAPLLSSPAGHFGELTWDVEPSGTQRLDVPEGAPLEPLLRLLARRGLAPQIATRLLEVFPARPLERALLAWDFASGALLGADDSALYSQITAEIAPLKAFGGTRATAVPRDRIGDLIEAARSHIDGDPLPSLAALARAPGNNGNVAAALAHARQLSLAHLPSLGLAFAQIAWARFGAPEALDALIEIALDHGLTDAIPTMTGQDAQSMVQQTYLLVRDRLSDYAAAAARQILEGLLKHPGVASSHDPRLALAMAEVNLQSGETPNAALAAAVSAAAPAGTRWRYAAYVRESVAIQPADVSPVSGLDSFITTFGNYAPMWAQASYHDAQRAELLAMLARELRYQVHDPDAWRAFSIFVEDDAGDAIGTEVDSRLAAQLADVLE